MVHRADGRDDELRRRGEAPDVDRDLHGDVPFLPRRVESPRAHGCGAGCDRHDPARGRGRGRRGSRQPRDRCGGRPGVARRRAGRGCPARARPRARRRGAAHRRGLRPAGRARGPRALRSRRASRPPPARSGRGGAPPGDGCLLEVHRSRGAARAGRPSGVERIARRARRARGQRDVGPRRDVARVGHRRRRRQDLPGRGRSVEHGSR